MCFVGIIKVEKSQDCLVTCLPVGQADPADSEYVKQRKEQLL